MDFVLELDGIGKNFGPVVALDLANLRVRPGSVHALIGENGAGKTTLMRIAFGLTGPDVGVIRLDGMPARLSGPSDAIRAGIGMVQQHFTLVPAMTVLENVTLGLPGRATVGPDEVLAVAAEAGLPVDPAARVATLSVSAQQRVELVKSLVRKARLLILDEPTAALVPSEADELLNWLRRFASRGGSAVLITHKLREALEHADDITVLRSGTTVLHGPRTEMTSARLVSAMLGSAGARRPAQDPGPAAGASRGNDVASTDALDVRDARGLTRIRSATLRVGAGEIIGLAGVEGSGCRELLRAMAGRIPPSSGTRVLPARIGFVPEDRHQDALVLDESVADNVALRGAGARRGVFRRSRVLVHARRLVADHGIAAPDVRAPVYTLSGGNQQRLVLARELDGAPTLLVVENPTRGLDIKAAADVQQRIRDAARRGAGVLYFSSDLDEVIGMSDRVLVVHAGRVREVPRERESVGRAMLGAA